MEKTNDSAQNQSAQAAAGDSAQNKNVVVFVHGLDENPEYAWTNFIEQLRSQPLLEERWAFLTYNYLARTVRFPAKARGPNVRLVAEGLRSFVDFQCRTAKEICFIGNGVGGRVIRKYLVEEVKRNRVPLKATRAMLCGAPTVTSDLERLHKRIPTTNQQLAQMVPDAEFLVKLNKDWETFRIQDYLTLRFVVGGLDTVVPEQSMRYCFADDLIEVAIDKNHRSITRPTAADDIVVSMAADILCSPLTAGSRASEAETRASVVNRLREPLQELDAKVRAHIGGEIKDARKEQDGEDVIKKFHSERLLSSLAGLGIPFSVAFQVVAEVVETLVRRGGQTNDLLTTRDLRRIVYDIIQEMARRESSHSAAAEWINQYARRYGNPEKRLEVKIAGTRQPLTFALLEKMLIPILVSRATRGCFEQLPMLSRSARLKMSREILDAINGIRQYYVEVDTLHAIAWDLATQPPHPWFVESSGFSETVEYDLDRGVHWSDEVQAAAARLNLSVSHIRHDVQESCHHFCSAILGYYGAFLGVGQLAPLRQLQWHLNHRDDDHRWPGMVIGDLWRDLAYLGFSGNVFKMKINTVAKRVYDFGVEDTRDWAGQLLELREIAVALTMGATAGSP